MRKPAAAAEGARTDEQKPFDEHLVRFENEPADEPQPAQSKPSAKEKPAGAEEPGQPPTITPELPLPAATETAVPAEPVAQPQQVAPAPSPRPDVLPLPPTNVPAPASAAASAADAAPIEAPAPGVDALSSSAVDAPVEALADRAQAATRDGSLPAQFATAPELRNESAAAAQSKPPPAPPAPPEAPAESGRAGEILRQLRVHFSPELRSATIQLSPPELGRISIRMRIEKGELHALVRAERRETLDALQRHVPELRATLEQLGIQARELDLQLGFEQRGARQDARAPRAGGRAGAGHEHEPELREAQLLRTLSARSGGVDTYA